MKILLVSTQDYIHHPVPSRHHYIFEELAKKHEVHVAHFHVSRGETRPTRLIVNEATLIPFMNPLLHYTLNAPYHFHIFNKIIREERIEIVVAAHVLAGSAVIHAAKGQHVPVLFDLKDWFPDSAAAYFKNRIIKDIVKSGVWEITKRNLKQSNFITTVSPSLVEKLRGLGFSARLITNGVDTDIFYPMNGAGTRRALDIPEDDFVIGFAGSIERWYALDDMIRALPDLLKYNPATRLLIVGGSLFTDYQIELKKLARDLGISDRVHFTGIKPYNELPRYIACMDVCTIPLSPPRWGEIALPNKYFEYSACGKPIVMRPIPDVTQMGGANLFIYRTQEEYLAQIKNLMKYHPTFDINLENYSWKEKARQFEVVLSSLA
jgi:phosphatidylinositol alpha-1,6-mannosyltransferase